VSKREREGEREFPKQVNICVPNSTMRRGKNLSDIDRSNFNAAGISKREGFQQGSRTFIQRSSLSSQLGVVAWNWVKGGRV